MVEQVAEALVRLLDRAEARELTHRPQLSAVHRRVGPAGERVLAREPEVALGVPLGEVVLGVEGPDLVAGDRVEEGVALARAA